MLHAGHNATRSTLITALMLAGFFPLANAGTLHVPTEFSSVTDAINAAQDGDTILIDGTGPFPSVASGTVVDGITLTIAAAGPGAGIHIANDALTVDHAGFLTVRDLTVVGRIHATGNSTLLLEGVQKHATLVTTDRRSVTADGAASVTIRSSVIETADLSSVSRVRIENSALTGAAGADAVPNRDLGFPFGVIPGGPGKAGHDGLRLSACPKVTLANSSLAAGTGGAGIDINMSHFWGTFNAGPGGNGLTARKGTHAEYSNCQFSAGLHGTPVYGNTPPEGAIMSADSTSSILPRRAGSPSPSVKVKVEGLAAGSSVR